MIFLRILTVLLDAAISGMYVYKAKKRRRSVPGLKDFWLNGNFEILLAVLWGLVGVFNLISLITKYFI